MTSTADRTGHDGLSERLRAVARRDDAAGGAPYLDALVAGRLPRARYAELTAQYFFVYEALEQAALAMLDDPVAGLFVFPELNRLPAIMADLEFLLGPAWGDSLTASRATLTYCERLQEVAFTWPAGFVAHHYARYLDDLAGAAAVGSAVRRAYGLTDGGSRFFTFDGVDPAAFESRYRGLLDALPLGVAEQDRLLAEVSLAYRLHADVLEQWGRP